MTLTLITAECALCDGFQVLDKSLEAHVLRSDNSSLARDCRRDMQQLNRSGTAELCHGAHEADPWANAVHQKDAALAKLSTSGSAACSSSCSGGYLHVLWPTPATAHLGKTATRVPHPV